jgi:CheY-like chemotaxis protein
VLIVDDIAENRAVLGVCCEQFGVAYEAVSSGREAVEAASSGRFDLVFMDILMPGMDGVAATRAIRALPDESSQVPIIAVTTAAEPMDVLHYRACGITDVVAKPINVARLMVALETAVAAARRHRRSRSRHDQERLSA